PAGSSRGKVAHGSILNDNFRCCRVKSQWQSTLSGNDAAKWLDQIETVAAAPEPECAQSPSEASQLPACRTG
ncbi:hypothetical protein, partial [Paracoccus lutimaris]|uniref:hypothetical protein n=1 Tax=Paracoccus lutimaris TaxID=1490030 RepID=UPI001C69DCF0